MCTHTRWHDSCDKHFWADMTVYWGALRPVFSMFSPHLTSVQNKLLYKNRPTELCKAHLSDRNEQIWTAKDAFMVWLFRSLVVEQWTHSIPSTGCLRVRESSPKQSTCVLRTPPILPHHQSRSWSCNAETLSDHTRSNEEGPWQKPENNTVHTKWENGGVLRLFLTKKKPWLLQIHS